MRIAIFDYAVVPTNPAGGCRYRMIQGLCREHEFTVFAVLFENPCPEHIRWVRVPVPMRPAALRFVAFWIVAPLGYWWHRFRSGARFDQVQMAEASLCFGDVSYAHFCFRWYLRNQWKRSRPRGLRRFFYWLSFRLQALAELYAFRRVRSIVSPSVGLARELRAEYPFTAAKVCVLSNPVDVGRMRPPEHFDRQEIRRSFGLAPDDVVLVFVALGSYERKGLPLLIEALARVREGRLKLLVVGGPADLRADYKARAARMGLDGTVHFVETQRDVRPYLWAADFFALPSHYEVFPLVVLEAAAAGLPVLVTPLSGVEEFLLDGQNGILVDPSAEGILRGLQRFLALSPEGRRAMGRQAQRDVARYDTANFVAAWRRFYREFDAPAGTSATSAEREG